MDLAAIDPQTLAKIDLKKWEELCTWLDGEWKKCAYQNAVPGHLRRLVYKGGNSTGDAMREERWITGLIFYQSGWGWRLRKNWRERLAALIAMQDQAKAAIKRPEEAQ